MLLVVQGATTKMLSAGNVVQVQAPIAQAVESTPESALLSTRAVDDCDYCKEHPSEDCICPSRPSKVPGNIATTDSSDAVTDEKASAFLPGNAPVGGRFPNPPNKPAAGAKPGTSGLSPNPGISPAPKFIPPGPPRVRVPQVPPRRKLPVTTKEPKVSFDKHVNDQIHACRYLPSYASTQFAHSRQGTTSCILMPKF